MSSADKFWCWIICTAIASVSSCTAVGAYANSKKSAQTACVERALFHSDRLDCLKVRP